MENLLEKLPPELFLEIPQVFEHVTQIGLSYNTLNDLHVTTKLFIGKSENYYLTVEARDKRDKLKKKKAYRAIDKNKIKELLVVC